MRKFLFALFATLMLASPTIGQTTTEQPKPKAEYDGIEINWPTIEGHSVAVLQIGGPGTRQKFIFKNGEAPFFRPLSEGIKPHVIYSFRIEYLSDELAKKKSDYREARKNKDRKLALQLLGELQSSSLQCPMASGRFQVEESGTVKTYDLKSNLEKAAKEKKANSKKEERENESASADV